MGAHLSQGVKEQNMKCRNCGASNKDQLYTSLIHVEIPEGMKEPEITDCYLRASLVSAGIPPTAAGLELLKQFKDLINGAKK